MMTNPLAIIDFKHGFIKFLSLLPPRICIQHIFDLSISYIGRFLLSGVVDDSISEGIVARISFGNVSSCSMFLPYFYRNQVELNKIFAQFYLRDYRIKLANLETFYNKSNSLLTLT